jgi:uncharacterized membrane protein YcaP (DUF421 family)
VFSFLRPLAIYLFLLLIFRISGRRTMSEMTTFDFILLGDDKSVTNAMLVILSLVGLNILLAALKRKSKGLEKILDGVPMIVLENGQPLEERMRRARVDSEDVLSAARKTQGLERLEQIRYAVLERNGGISIIPKQAD